MEIMSKFTVLGLVALLVLLPATPLAKPAQPDNYCTSVEAFPDGALYDVVATGAGQYARIRDLVNNTTVVATNFGAGATSYSWQNVALPGTQYQVQVSHTSLTTGYSTTGCIFSPPVPQSIIIDRFEWGGGAFEWDATLDAVSYWVTTASGKRLTAVVYGQSPGSIGFFTYRAEPVAAEVDRLPAGLYQLWAFDAYSGDVGIVAEFWNTGW